MMIAKALKHLTLFYSLSVLRVHAAFSHAHSVNLIQ